MSRPRLGRARLLLSRRTQLRSKRLSKHMSSRFVASINAHLMPRIGHLLWHLPRHPDAFLRPCHTCH